MNKLPVYELILSDEMDGVSAVSLVHDPAVERHFVTMGKDKDMHRFSVASEEKHLATGVVMIPDMQIYRYNEKYGEHYVVFSKETIRRLMYKFFKNGYTSSVNTEHWNYCEGVYLVESYLKDSARSIVPVEFSDVPDGTWIATYRIGDVDLWERVKDGDFRGFSIEGYLTYADHEKEIDIEELISNFLKNEC